LGKIDKIFELPYSAEEGQLRQILTQIGIKYQFATDSSPIGEMEYLLPPVPSRDEIPREMRVRGGGYCPPLNTVNPFWFIA
jgi:hypothetical protein